MSPAEAHSPRAPSSVCYGNPGYDYVLCAGNEDRGLSGLAAGFAFGGQHLCGLRPPKESNFKQQGGLGVTSAIIF